MLSSLDAMMRARHYRNGPARSPLCFRQQLILAGCILCAICLLSLQLYVPYGFQDKAMPTVSKVQRLEKIRQSSSFRHNSTQPARAVTPHRSQLSPAKRKIPKKTTFPPVEAKTVRRKWTFNFTLRIKPTACQTQNGRCNFSEPVVTCVSSGASQFERRQAVRKTWGNWPNVRVLFFFGANESFQAKLIEETANYNDIVQYDFLDTYENLTYKSVSMLRFVSASKWDALKFVMKSDDDTFINVRLLPKVLAAIKRPGIFGSVQAGARPRREPKDKWYVPEEEFPENVFPSYVTGCFYIIPITQALQMSEHATDIHLLRFEDTYITGLLAKKLHIPRYQVPLAGVDWTNSRRRMQDVVKSLIAKHYVQPIQMLKMFAYMNDPRNIIA
ncbi:beta-1,3-galactosyltransferase 5-like [Varroa destructor]|uniref:Hexosyltransferase n=1 Tax=Varroa destructor TaxID=109461 RepID=A0A7M7JY32_VARDE|nr:beta-1,3-galactosyltransferase 5-like [Varroa destructor]